MSHLNDNDSSMKVDDSRQEVIDILELSIGTHKLQEFKRRVSFHNNAKSLLNSFGENALFEAIIQNKNSLVEKLLDMGVNPNNSLSYPPHIITAIRNTNGSALCMLVEAGADVNIQDADGQTALMATLLSRRIMTYSYLIRNGANINEQKVDGYTALHIATEQNREEFVHQLLADGADFNILTDNGRSPLDLAMDYRHFTIIEILLKAGATSTRYSGRVFRSAITKRKYELIKMLILRGINVDGKSDSSYTPLMTAAIEGDTKMLSLLINAGADIHKQVDGTDADALAAAVSSRQLNAVILLIACGAKVNKRTMINFRRESLLTLAARWGDKRIVAVLLAKGAKTHHRDSDGKTAYDIAMKCGHRDIAEMIQKTPDLIGVMSFMRCRIRQFQEEDGLQKDKLK